MTVVYQGEKHCQLMHDPSGALIETDAPKDNHGKGQAFSPTDLTSVSLLSCMLTTIAIKMENAELSFNHSKGHVYKIMGNAPRKIVELRVELELPKILTTEQRTQAENAALSCPVKLSLHPDILISTTFLYK